MTLRPKNADFLPCWRRRLSVLLRSNAVEVCWRLKRLGRTFSWHNCEGETKTQTFTSSLAFLSFIPHQARLNSTPKHFARDRRTRSRSLAQANLRMGAVTQAVVAASNDVFLADDFTNA